MHPPVSQLPETVKNLNFWALHFTTKLATWDYVKTVKNLNFFSKNHSEKSIRPTTWMNQMQGRDGRYLPSDFFSLRSVAMETR